MGTFNLLSKSLQRRIWEMKWESFTPIQEQSIPVILQTNHDVIISAGTASGKTEAAFLPILTAVEESAKKSVKVIYISPLKALLNNQFERTQRLCEYMDIAINSWHGDVSAAKKKSFLKNPTGILQITPESIESLFVNRTTELETLFSEVEFIVIDEIHSFINTERGAHLRSLLSRMGRISKKRPRIIGLSATINNFEVVQKWVNFKNWETVEIVEDKFSDKTLLYYLMYFELDDQGNKPVELFKDIRDLTMHEKAIIFCNSRANVENTAMQLNQLAGTETYYVHHAAIDKKEREYVEQLMVETMFPKSVVATSTLELGIDIGTVDLVIQMDSTYTVSSLKQRLGRSGRKNGSQQVLQLYATHPDSLLQSVAMMELLFEKWVEPATGYPLPYDVLVQQILSVCAEKNGIVLKELMTDIKQNDSFSMLEISKIEALINYLLKQDILEKIKGRNELIVGFEGEKLLRSRDFYAMFETFEEYEVIEKGKKIGKIDKTPWLAENDNLMLAGKLWTIISLDDERNHCYVELATNGIPPKFQGSGGKIHQKIGEKMHELLCGNHSFDYLDSQALKILGQLRQSYQQHHVKSTERILWRENQYYIFETFTSTKITATLSKILQLMNAKVYKCDSIGRIYFSYIGNIQDLKKFEGSAEDLLELKDEKINLISKYAEYIPQQFKEEMYLQKELDLEGALDFLKKMKLKVINKS